MVGVYTNLVNTFSWTDFLYSISFLISKVRRRYLFEKVLPFFFYFKIIEFIFNILSVIFKNVAYLYFNSS